MKEITMNEASNLPSFSVVINTYNRAQFLDDAIRGVMQLDYPNFELIVVNGPSTDHTNQILDSWSNKIKIRYCNSRNLSISRNIGIAAAAGDVIAFIDDDAVPHPKWLEKLAYHYKNPCIGGVGGFTVDNTGVRWQVKKTICDRFGNAYNVDDFFNEDALNFPKTPYFPSLLGTNSSFRRIALEEIGGFDNTFAYFLDETDVCLRLVDANWHIKYEPSALIFHQFAESHIRSHNRQPRSLYPSVVSKCYFISRHGMANGYDKQFQQISIYREELFRANAWLAEHGNISYNHKTSLDLDVEQGTRDGIVASQIAFSKKKNNSDLIREHDPHPFIKQEQQSSLRVVLVCQGIPPKNDAGIARWTKLVAEGLKNLGVCVHIITRSDDLPTRYYKDGIWYHAISADEDGASTISYLYDVPEHDLGRWISAVMKEIAFLKTFGLKLVSFPIWDLEALPSLDDPDILSIMSLHTTYYLARPFKPEWNTRIIYGHKVIKKVIEAEKNALLKAKFLLANSNTIIKEIEQGYGIAIKEKSYIIPHGTPDLLEDNNITLDVKLINNIKNKKLHVLVPCRFELRKGYDLALKLAKLCQNIENIHFDFIGQNINDDVFEKALEESSVDIKNLKNCSFHGQVDRKVLDDFYIKSDLVLMLSRFESFGLVAIEALSAGTPVLALKAGALPEVIKDNYSGWIIPEDKSFLPKSFEILKKLSENKEKIHQFSKNARVEYNKNYTIEHMASGILEVYRSMLAQG